MGSRPEPGATGRRSIGIMGGTFDPIHYGHLVTAEVARYAFQLDHVVFLPSGRPPHKEGRRVSDGEHRYLMVVIASVDNANFRVSRMELDRSGKSYTIDTVREFRRRHGPAVDLWFITGADAIVEMMAWKEPGELLRECRFIAATRPGHSLDIESLSPLAGDRIVPLQVPALAISSSDIRRRVSEEQPIRYLVPPSVENYIHKHRLYRERVPGREAGAGGA